MIARNPPCGEQAWLSLRFKVGLMGGLHSSRRSHLYEEFLVFIVNGKMQNSCVLPAFLRRHLIFLNTFVLQGHSRRGPHIYRLPIPFHRYPCNAKACYVKTRPERACRAFTPRPRVRACAPHRASAACRTAACIRG